MYVAMCLASSLDGRIAAAPHTSPNFTSPADLGRLYQLRAWADVLLIGASTVRQEQVLPLIRNPEAVAARQQAGKPPHPAAAIVSRSLDLPYQGRYFTYRKQRLLVLTGTATPEQRQQLGALDLELLETGTDLDLTTGLHQLALLGFRKVLAEGGGVLTHSLLDNNLVDRIYLTLAPVFFGGTHTPTLVTGPSLTVPRRFQLSAVQPHEGELHLVYDRPPAQAGMPKKMKDQVDLAPNLC